MKSIFAWREFKNHGEYNIKELSILFLFKNLLFLNIAAFLSGNLQHKSFNNVSL